MIQRVTQTKTILYPVLILSLPLGGLNFLASDEIRGFALIVLLEVLLAFLVYKVIFESERPFFAIGLVTGILFWTYQPASIFFVVVLTWMSACLLSRRELKKFCYSGLFGSAGFFIGCLPHLLAEINNGFINTRGLFLSSNIADRGHISHKGLLANISSALLTDLDASRIISYLVVLAFVAGLSLSVYLFIKKRNRKTIFLPVIYAFSIIILAMSNYPPTPRYIVHYKLFSFMTFLLAIVPFNTIRSLRSRGAKIIGIIIFVIFSCWRWVGQFPLTLQSHRNNIVDIEELKRLAHRPVLGHYWNTMRWKPFLAEDQPLFTVPRAVQLGSVFTFAKYYPAALNLGEYWCEGGGERVFLLHRYRERETDLLMTDFGIKYEKHRLPSNRYVLFKDFSRPLSPAFFDLMVQRREGRYARQKRVSFRFFKEIVNRISGPLIRGGGITLTIPAVDPSLLKKIPRKELKDWRCELIKGDHRISFPLDFTKRSITFSFPPYITCEPGEYRQHVTFLDTPIRDLGSINIEAEKGQRSSYLVFTRLRDIAFYGPLRDITAGEKFKKGLPIDCLEIRTLSSEVERIEFHIYSVFDFSSSIWNRHFDQVLYVNHHEFPLYHGNNRIVLPLSGEKRLRLKVKHKSLLNIIDSLGNFQFFNTGILLEKIIVHIKNRAGKENKYAISPLLRRVE